MSADELVILVDEDDQPIGEAEKLEAHRRGLLHRAVSLFAFNGRSELLVQRRAASKYHSGGLWSNTCCSHPRPGEPLLSTVNRRLAQEMGIECRGLREVAILRYRAQTGELIEDELDHLFTARVDHIPDPDPAEVEQWRFIAAAELDRWLAGAPGDFTAWFPEAWARIKPHRPRVDSP